MSCFIVEPETIDVIVGTLYNLDRGALLRDAISDGALGREMRSLIPPKNARLLGQKLLDLNARAYSARYREVVDLPKHLGETPQEYPIPRAYRAMCCWLHQCTEGADIERDPLYTLVQDAAARLAHLIATATPEVQAQPWQ